MKHTLSALALLFALLLGSARPSAQAVPWSEATQELFATLPLQDGGRVKPYDTFAQFCLLRFHGKRVLRTEGGEKLGPVPFLLDCLFRPDVARGYRVFLVRDRSVLEAVGVRVEGRKKSDRYSYDELLAGREKLFAEGDRIRRVPEPERKGLEPQLFALAVNLHDFESLLHGLDFARATLSTEQSPWLRARFGEQPTRGVSAYIARAEEVRAAVQGEFEQLSEEEREVEYNALEEISRELTEALRNSRAFAAFPPADLETEAWLFADEAAELAFQGQEPEALQQLVLWEKLVAVQAIPADSTAFERELRALHASVTGLADRRGEYSKVPLEVKFYRGDYFTRALAIFLLAFVVLLCTWLWPRVAWLATGTFWLTALATLFLVVGVTLRCIIRERPPISTLYETILFVAGSCAIVLLVIEFFQRQRIALALAPILGAAGMFLAMKYELKEAVSARDTMPSLVAVLDTNFWLATHVTTITLGYAAGLLAAVLGNLWLLGKMFGLKKADKDFYRTVTRMTYGVICFGLVFSVVGTILGGVWANYSWGRFWGWDPKENGALLICLAEILILHARMGGYIKEHGLAVLSALNGLCVAFSWWHVNNLGVGLHSYGKAEGVLLALYTYYGIGLGIVLASGLWRLWTRGQAPALQAQR